LATVYPGAKDAWNNPTSTTAMNAAGFEHDVLHTNTYDAIEAIENELGINPSGTFGDVKARLDSVDTQLSGGYVRSPYLTVASTDLQTSNPTAYASADFQCDGTDDQTQINNALKRASRVSDGFNGAQGFIGVFLMGGNFYIGQNGTPIQMYPNTKLMGGGAGTLLRPAFPGVYTGGVIEVINTSASRFTISDLSIGRPDYTHWNGSGIHLITIDDGQTYDLKSGNDAFIKIFRVNVFTPNLKGIWMQGGREVQIDNCHIQNPIQQGIWLNNHSDGKIQRVVVTGIDGLQPGIQIGSGAGNSQLTDCKVFYRGTRHSGYTATGDPTHGFYIDTSRVTIANCQAQDNGGYGFYFTSGADDVTATNLLADSNSSQSSTMGGFYVGAPGVYESLHALDRGPTIGDPPQVRPNRQLRGIVFAGSPQVMMSGRVTVPSGSNHLVNAPGSGYVRLVRSGTTTYSFG
jgi:hypothetical protein